MERILITGGCGFVGSNLAVLLKEKYSNYQIVSIDNLKRRGSELNLSRLKNAGIEFIHGDIRNKEDLNFNFDPTFIIDAAAEPSVMAGMNGMLSYLIHTNLSGTIHSLELAEKTNAKFIFLSTSRVYPIEYIEQIKLEELETRFQIAPIQHLPGISEAGIDENFLMNKARSFYGATKYASELMIQEFHAFNNINTVINRCGVIAGPYQMGKVDQGVIALWVAKHFWKQDITYIGYGGSGKQVRDVLHIADLFNLIDFQIHNFEKINGKTFNVGGGLNCSTSLKELTEICSTVTGNKVPIHSKKETRKGDIPLYITNNTNIENFCDWKPQKNITEIVMDTFKWIKENEHLLKSILAS